MVTLPYDAAEFDNAVLPFAHYARSIKLCPPVNGPMFRQHLGTAVPASEPSRGAGTPQRYVRWPSREPHVNLAT